MTYLNGGYSIIKKGDANIYASLEKALTNGKPILFYEDDNTCYYIDSISKSGDDIVLTKGGKTITITDSNVVTENGDIQGYKPFRVSLIDTSNNSYHCDVMLNDLKYALDTNLSIDEDLKSYLDKHSIAYQKPLYEESNDSLYNFSDWDEGYDIQIFDMTGTSSVITISLVRFTKI